MLKNLLKNNKYIKKGQEVGTKRVGFTLIELMVVVAVIAILATLGVTSFVVAIRRSRNATRQSDVEAVAKAMETCYDSMSGLYGGLPTTGTSQTVTTDTTTTAGTIFAAATNNCLVTDIVPTLSGFNYTVVYQADVPQIFTICAQLEQVTNWGSIGNTATLPTIANDAVVMGADCGDPSGSNTCYFCVTNQQ